MTEDLPFTVTSTRIAYETPYMRIKEDIIVRKDGQTGVYSTVISSDSVVIIAVDDHARICIEEVYRHPIGKWQLELPSGGTDDEDPLVASDRELLEETGIIAGSFEILGRTLACSGRLNEYQVTVLARNLSIQPPAEPEDEVRNIQFYSRSEIDQMIKSGKLDDSSTFVALFLYDSWLDAQGHL